MNSGLISGLPLLILIVGALCTRRIVEPALISSVIAVAMLEGTGVVQGYAAKMYEVLTDSSFQLLVIVSLGFGGLSTLLEKSGAMLGFHRIIERVCKGPKRTIFFTWLLGGIIFIDDYLNALAVSASMKGISDRLKIPREHLAYTVNCMGACICVMVPVSSWAAFAIGCSAEYSLTAVDYYRAIPFMFYPICAVLISLLLAVGRFPQLGELKRAYRRVEQGGSVLPADKTDESGRLLVEQSGPAKAVSGPWNFLFSMVVLIAGMLLFDNNIVTGLILTIVFTLALLTIQRRMKLTEAADCFLQGAAGIVPMLITIFLAYIMESAISQMGFIAHLTGLISHTIPAPYIPVVAFVSVGGITFFAASFWALIVISFPIFLPMAIQLGVDPSLVIAAVMSGVALGSQACLYSDAVFMVAAGTDVTNGIQFRTALPYVGIGAMAAMVLFLITGFVMG